MKKKVFLSVLVTLLAVSLMAACGEQKEIMEIETVSVSEEQEVESVSSGEEPVKEEEMVSEEQEAEQKTEPEPEPVVVKPEPEPIVVPEPIVEPEPIVIPEPIVEPEPEPIVVPEPEPITPPVSSSLPYIRDGRIYLDVREDPEAVNSVLVMTTDSDKWTNELRASRQKLLEYGAYFPVIGEITTYVPEFENLGTFTADLLDGGIFYVHYTPEIVWDIFGNLTTAVVPFVVGDTFVLGIDFTNNNDIPHEEGLYYFGIVGEGQIKYVVRFYVYFV